MKRKNIVVNFLFQFIYQILIMLIPLITAPYLARTLGVDGVGIYAYNYAIAYYFVLFTRLGIDNYGAREIARININSEEQLSEKFCTLFTSKLMIGALSLFLYIMYIFIFVDENKVIAWIFCLYIISAIIDINWFYIGIENFKLISLRNIIIKIFTTICIFLFVKSRSDLNIYTLIMVGGTYFLSQFIGWGFVIKHIKLIKPRFNDVLHSIKPMFVLFIPVLAMSIYRQMDKIMLGAISGTYQVGLYEYTEKIFMILVCVSSVCGDVGMPRVVSLLSTGQKGDAAIIVDRFVDFGLCISFAMAFGISAISNNFIYVFYGKEFLACIDLLNLLSPTIIFLSISIIIRKEYLIPYAKEKIFVYATCIGAIINFVLNSILIPHTASRGAIIATIITEFFVMAFQMFYIRKKLPLKKYFIHGLWFLISGAIMWTIIKLSLNSGTASWGLVWKGIIIGIVSYSFFTLLFVLKVYRNELIDLIRKKIG